MNIKDLGKELSNQGIMLNVLDGTIELIDISTDITIGIARGDSIEQALATIMRRLADTKKQAVHFNGLSRL